MEKHRQKHFAFLMDPIEKIHVKKDTTFALMLAAQELGHTLFYLQAEDLFVESGEIYATLYPIEVFDDPRHWFAKKTPLCKRMTELDTIFMRKDPPVDPEYLYITQLLSHLTAAGVQVINPPQALRDFNEKLLITYFPECSVPTFISSQAEKIRAFIAKYSKVVLKPLHGMGGTNIFLSHAEDLNLSVIIENLTDRGQHKIMIQRFIPEVRDGDKRILMIKGEPYPYALARIPAAGELRGNLAAGATGKGVELTARDRWLCQQIQPFLEQHRIFFAGVDVIGEYITEINITSPTCVREIERAFDVQIAKTIIEKIEG